MSKPCSAKYEGAGNRFILIDDREEIFLVQDVATIAREVDGVILLQRHPTADFRMRIFNRDGSEAAMCGNGLRCLVRFLIDLGFEPKPYRIAIGNRIVDTFFVGDRIAVRIGEARNLILHQKVSPWWIHSVDTGVPHAVLFVPNVETIDIEKEAPLVRHHPSFHPHGVNVNFAAQVSQDLFAVRTFERGVERETLSCGSGAAAVAVIAKALYGLSGPIWTRFRGGKIEVRLDGASTMTLVGEAIRGKLLWTL